MANRFFSPMVRGGDPLMGLYRDMNRLFDDVFSGTSMRSMGGIPALDVRDEDDGLCVAAELPGVKPDDVDVRLDGDLLTISGEKRSDSDPQQNAHHVMERSYGRFSRSVQLPFRPDPDQVQADFEHGVLTVHLKRSPQQQGSRRIPVRGPTGGSQMMQSGGGAAQASGSSAGASTGGSAQMGGSTASAGGSQMSGSSDRGRQMGHDSTTGSSSSTPTGG
ncbi:MAG TPA: Hsp20 family protein [Caldimonas sp.]|nr:Hsp20 family protein [Caldimonas sp.]